MQAFEKLLRSCHGPDSFRFFGLRGLALKPLLVQGFPFFCFAFSFHLICGELFMLIPVFAVGALTAISRVAGYLSNIRSYLLFTVIDIV